MQCTILSGSSRNVFNAPGGKLAQSPVALSAGGTLHHVDRVRVRNNEHPLYPCIACVRLRCLLLNQVRRESITLASAHEPRASRRPLLKGYILINATHEEGARYSNTAIKLSFLDWHFSSFNFQSTPPLPKNISLIRWLLLFQRR